MSDTKVLTPEQTAELRAAIAAHPDHANVPSEECPRCAWQSKLGDVALATWLATTWPTPEQRAHVHAVELDAGKPWR